MSCYVVGDKTINRIVTYIGSPAMEYNIEPLKAMGYLLPTPQAKQTLAQDMLTLNIKSFDARYPDKADEPCDKKFKFKELPCDDPYQVLMSMNCYLYQACEGDCDKDPLYLALRSVAGELANDIVRKLPEYEKCKWE